MLHLLELYHPGRATSTMEFDHYAETPSNISEQVIAEIQGKKEE